MSHACRKLVACNKVVPCKSPFGLQTVVQKKGSVVNDQSVSGMLFQATARAYLTELSSYLQVLCGSSI